MRQINRKKRQNLKTSLNVQVVDQNEQLYILGCFNIIGIIVG